MLSINFHVSIYRRASEVEPASAMALFDRTFEEVVDSLSSLPRMFIEPDGAFVWVGSAESAWQLDGTLYDGPGRLWYVELKGRSPLDDFNRLLSTLGWPETPLVFQLVREAVLLDEAQFRHVAGWEPMSDRNRKAAG